MRTSPSAKSLLTTQQLKRVRARSDLVGTGLVLHAWLVIAAMMVLFAALPNPVTFVLALMVIGSRQLGLLILMHDGAHGLLTNNRSLNDFLSQWFCAYPTFADTFIYRTYHLKHHARTLQDGDPDLVLTGHYPISRQSLRRKLWRDISGQTGLSQRRQQLRGALGDPTLPWPRRLGNLRRNLGKQLLVNALLWIGLSVVGYWYLYPLLWLLPLLTWQQMVLRIRNIAEHAVLVERDNPFRNARTTIANPLERMFLAPYWVNYHLEHHLMMWVPCYRLPMLRKYLLAAGYGDDMETIEGYRAVLRFVTVDTDDGGQARRGRRAVGTFSDGFSS